MGSWVVDLVEALDPPFHTINGDLSYANSMAKAHDYERMYPVRGVEPGSATLQPHVTAAVTGALRRRSAATRGA